MYLYDKSQFGKFKFKFSGLESIEKSYSQALQDMFVLSALRGKKNGSFLEVGADDPHFISNTFLIESEFGWNGISVDITQSSMDRFRSSNRTSEFILGDALGLDYDRILSNKEIGLQMDYLSLDLEPNSQTLECLKKLPLDKFRLSVITYETDAYDTNSPGGFEGSQSRRDESRDILKFYGYVLVSGNISNLDNGLPFEDWYLDPSVIDKETIEKFKRSDDNTLAAHFYMFN